MRQDDETVAKCLNEDRPEAVDLDALISSFAGHTCRTEGNLFIMILCTMARLRRKQQREFTTDMILGKVGTPDFVVEDESRKQWFHVIGRGQSIGIIEFEKNILLTFGTIERTHFDKDIVMHLRPWKTTA